MRKLLFTLIFLLTVITVSAQFSPTGTKTRFVNGLALGTKLDGSLSAQVDSNAIWWRADSALMVKYKGASFRIGQAGSGGSVLYSDTSAMLANRLKISDTLTQLSGYVRNGFPVLYTDTSSMLANRLKISDTLTQLSGYVRKGFPVLYTDSASMLANRLKISDTSLMLINYPRYDGTRATGTWNIGITGNATTATALATGRTIAITGDLAYTSPSFDGSGNITAAGTLASVITAGGPIGSASVVPVITYDAKGRLTAVSTATIVAGSTAGTLTIGTDLSGTSFNGSSAITIANTSTLTTVTGRGASTSTGISLTENGNLAASYALYLKRNTDTGPLGYLIQAQNAAATANLFTVDVSGNIIGAGTIGASNFSGTSSGTNTGDQTITLTGGVTGSGVGSFAATVVTNANLTGIVTSTGNATSIAGNAITDGYIASAATWNAKQAAYTNLTSIGALVNGAGWLYNNGTGTFSYSTPTAANVGAPSGSGTSTGTNTGDETTTRINALYGYTPANPALYLPLTGGTLTGLLSVSGTTSVLPNVTGSSQSAGQRVRLSSGDGQAVLDIGGAGDSGFWLQVTNSTNLATNYPLLLNPNGGNVGIGTTSPYTKFHIVGGNGSSFPAGLVTSTNSSMIVDDNTSMVAGVGGSIAFLGYKTGTSAKGIFSYIKGGKYNSTAGDERGYIAIGVSQVVGGSGVEAMRINPTGNVSIGNTNDTYKLDVSGTGKFSGLITAAGKINITDVGNTTIPGMQLNSTSGISSPSANQLNFITNSVTALSIASNQAATFANSVTSSGGLWETNQLIQYASVGGSNVAWAWQLSDLVSGDMSLSSGTTATGGTLTRRMNITSAGATNFYGSITGTSIIKSGGTASQFLKADGSVDANDYLLTSSINQGTTNYVAKYAASLTIVNSQIFDNGTNVTINKGTPTANTRFQIRGASAYTSNTNFTLTTEDANGILGFVVDDAGNISSKGVSANYTAVTAAYTILSYDYMVVATGGSNYTITLPTAVGILGKIYIIKNNGATNPTLGTTSSQTIDGATTKSLATTYSTYMVQSDGANWNVITFF